MYGRLLVTLDGSALGEKAVPHAVALARAFGATLDLLRVVPLALPEGPSDAGAVSALAQEADEAAGYLGSLRGELAAAGLDCRTSVRSGDVADEILRHAEEIEADLIVMSTHGRSGLGRWVYGSVADRVLRQAETPVLLVRATE
jgi:nucleotide-binding universal stress UspA family protein